MTNRVRAERYFNPLSPSTLWMARNTGKKKIPTFLFIMSDDGPENVTVRMMNTGVHATVKRSLVYSGYKPVTAETAIRDALQACGVIDIKAPLTETLVPEKPKLSLVKVAQVEVGSKASTLDAATLEAAKKHLIATGQVRAVAEKKKMVGIKVPLSVLSRLEVQRERLNGLLEHDNYVTAAFGLLCMIDGLERLENSTPDRIAEFAVNLPARAR